MQRQAAIPILLLAALFLVAMTMASEHPKESKGGRFLVKATHTPEECLKTLDETSAKGKDVLSKFEWGCMSGDHTGYALLEGKDEMAIKKMLPAGMQEAKIVKVDRFTAEQIKTFHEKH